MSKDGTEFSKYAQMFREVIDGNKTNFDILTKDLLKMGLTDIDKAYIDDEYPTYNDEKGERHFEGNKGDVLRKYYGGTNDLSNLIPKLETEFDEEFRERYCEELQDYNESKIMEFAQVLKIDVNENDIDIVSEAIAEYYSSIVIGSATKKSRKGKKVKDELESDRNKIALSYTLDMSEKKALVKLCELIKKTFNDLKIQTDKICNKQHELRNLTDSPEDKRWKAYLLYDIDSLKKCFDETYLELEKLCADVVLLLKTKKGIHESLGTIISIASNIHSDEYKITCRNKFKYTKFSNMVKRFNDSYGLMLRDIDKL